MQEGQLEARRGIIGPAVERPPEAAVGLRELAENFLHHAHVDVRFRRRAVQNQGSHQAVERLLGAAEGRERDTAVVQHFGQIGAQRKRSIETRQRLGIPNEAQQRNAALDMRLRIARQRGDRRIQGREGLLVAAERDQCGAAADQIGRLRWVMAGDQSRHSRARRSAYCPSSERTTARLCSVVKILGVDRQRRRVALQRLGQTAQLLQRIAAIAV